MKRKTVAWLGAGTLAAVYVGAVASSPSASTGTCASATTGATAVTQYPVTIGTDAYSAIQAQINAANAAGGGVVLVPAGTYALNGHLNVKSRVRLQGAGIGQTVLQAGPNFYSTQGPSFGYPVAAAYNAQDVTIAGMTLDQGGLKSTSYDRWSAGLMDVRSSTNVVVDHVATRNPFTYSVWVTNSSNFCVNSADVQVASSNTDQLDGIHVLDSSSGSVVNSTVDNRFNGATSGDDGIALHTINGTVHDINVSGNKVRGGSQGDGLQFAAGNYDIFNITVQANEFWGSPEGVRTGYYDGGTGNVNHVTIDSNNIHDLVPGIAFPNGGDAVWVFNSPKSASNLPTYFTVTNNNYCNAGSIKVVMNTGTTVSGNTLCGPTPSPTATSPSPSPTITSPSPSPTPTPTKKHGHHFLMNRQKFSIGL